MTKDTVKISINAEEMGEAFNDKALSLTPQEIREMARQISEGAKSFTVERPNHKDGYENE